MKDILQRIATHAHKVPGGVSVRIENAGRIAELRIGNTHHGCVVSGEGVDEEEVFFWLYRLVKAIEAADQHSFFTRVGKNWAYKGTDSLMGFFQESDHECVNLAECLAAVMEALPEVKNES